MIVAALWSVSQLRLGPDDDLLQHPHEEETDCVSFLTNSGYVTLNSNCAYKGLRRHKCLRVTSSFTLALCLWRTYILCSCSRCSTTTW